MKVRNRVPPVPESKKVDGAYLRIFEIMRMSRFASVIMLTALLTASSLTELTTTTTTTN